ncbi:Hypothetical protein NTJ_00722 [Nesidiocoris tenuis]|uniref:Transmembrane protein n=1 Tax=Nesidiocoris tenuis TaxID=355587 RepID=A0ABN7AAM4_9HEMI|nr:Hypothetical protein NTJ_00722 [Nesidiocoris tenuis]
MPKHEDSPEPVRSSRHTARSHDSPREDQVDSSPKPSYQDDGRAGVASEPIIVESQSHPSPTATAADDLSSTIAIAITNHIGTRKFLSFDAGDRIVDIVREGPYLVGTLDGTERRGFFHPRSVKFEPLDEPPPQLAPGSSQRQIPQEQKESSPAKRVASTKVTSTPPARPSTPSRRQSVTSKPDHNRYVILGCIFAVLAYLAYSRQFTKFRWGKPPAINVTEIMGQFKFQDPEMWDLLRAGLMPSKREEVQTFLFLHNNKPTTECLIGKLSDNYCAVYKASDISFDESFTSRMKDDLQSQQCMVVYDLENLNADGVKVLKGFCDAYTPIVRNAKFFFALNAGGQQLSNRLARQILESKWSESLTHDDFGGTVTRLTQNVLTVSKEDPVPC